MEYGRSSSNLYLCASSSDPISELTSEFSREVTVDAVLYVGELTKILVEDGRSLVVRIGVCIPGDAGCRIGVAILEDAGCRIGVSVPGDAGRRTGVAIPKDAKCRTGVAIPEDAGCGVGVEIPEGAECRDGEGSANCLRGDVGSSSQDGTVRLKPCSEP